MSSKLPVNPENSGELLLYQTQDGLIRVEAMMIHETIWLTQQRMADLFGVDRTSISRHLKNIFESNELNELMVCAEIAHTTQHGAIPGKTQTQTVKYYNLDAVISVGYRVNSVRATQFRIWATQRLREYIIKGFTMDDERLKQAGGGDYFDELLARIRDIRSSEKVFWKKVLDIYATSIDYDPNIETSQQFFKIVQNKMHWAAHGHTAAEIIKGRADTNKPNMGLTSFSGKALKRTDVGVAKNYLDEEELDTLNRIVSFYLEFAELQAKNRRTMHMQDWITKLDDFLRLSERDILTHAGKVSNEAALEHANAEFDKYRQRQLAEKSRAEKDFEKSLNQLGRIEATAKKDKKGEQQ